MLMKLTPGINRSGWKSAHEEISAKYNVKDTSHQELNQLSSVDQLAAKRLPEHLLSNVLKFNIFILITGTYRMYTLV